MLVVKKIMSLAVSIAMISPLVLQADEVKLDNQVKKYSYIVGLRAGISISKKDTLDMQALMLGIEDQIKGNDRRLDDKALRDVLIEQRRLSEVKKMAQGKANAEAGKAFLAKNKTAEGVTTLDNGLQYKVIKEGKGDSPKATDKVTVHYEGRLIDGTVFDSSIKRGKPAQFRLNGVVAGFREALIRMKPGSKWTVYMPSELAYGARGAGAKIGPNSTLIFDMELISIENPKETAKAGKNAMEAFKAALEAQKLKSAAAKQAVKTAE